MAEEAKTSSPILGKVDKVFDKFSSYLSARISAFVAFLFILIAVGTFYGYFIIPRFQEFSLYLLIAPVALAMIAYYNRTFASILFVGLLFSVFII